jgi:hypothetical protein
VGLGNDKSIPKAFNSQFLQILKIYKIVLNIPQPLFFSIFYPLIFFKPAPKGGEALVTPYNSSL